MRRNNKGTIVALASLVILLAGTAAVGATYALWSDKTSVNTHLQSGNLKAKLERTSLTTLTLDEDTGYLVSSTDSSVVDLSSPSSNSVNAFGIGEDDLVVPGAYYEAAFKLSNEGSVAFGYDVSIKLDTASVTDLAKQIKVYVDGADKGYLYTDDSLGSHSVAIGSLSKEDQAKTFTIKIAFDDLETNNSAMEQDAKFDLSVTATQLISED